MPTVPEAHWAGQWADIVPPQAPAAPADPVIVAVLALLAVLCVLALVLALQPGARARRALRRLARDARRSRLAPRPACLQIRLLLCSGLGQAQLHSVHWQDAADADWQAYLERLGAHCFAAQAPDRVELAALIDEALDWLARRTVTG